jgi:hypothetical protein
MSFAPIEGFFGEYHFLSNFSEEGGVKPTVEHWFQAGKAARAGDGEAIMASDTPNEAKWLGQWIDLRSDWEEIKVGFMRELLYEKFEKPTIQAKLIATHPRVLIETNDWGDDFWGDCSGNGKNVLGELLEEVRQWYTSVA